MKRRQAGAPEPAKFLGHGICDNASRSVTLARHLAGAADIAEQAGALLAAMAIPAGEVRGLGIQVGCDPGGSCRLQRGACWGALIVLGCNQGVAACWL